MKLKQFSIALLLSGLAMGATAQSNSSFIIRAGVNLANISVDKDGGVDDNKMLTSFQIGAIADLPIADVLSLQPGLVFSGKGAKSQSGETSDANYFRATTNPWYVEIPVNLVFKTPGTNKFFIGAGPYLGIGIGGKNKVEGKLLGSSFSSSENIEWSNDDPTTSGQEGGGYGILRRFDYGLNGTVGVEFNRMVISANYGHGLAKLQSDANSSEDNRNKHRVWSFTLGVRL